MRIKWNRAAFKELRLSPGVQADVMRRAEAVATAAGDGFEAELMAQSKTRARAIVKITTNEAARRNSTENTLINNLDAGS